MTRVAVFGAGVAGLSAAHALARLGHAVIVYEENDTVGGFFRSARRPEDGHMPSEYSWHGLGPWYHNTFDVMKEIPYDDSTVYDTCLSRPMNFGIAHDEEAHDVFDKTAMFKLSFHDKVIRAWVMAKVWCSDRRSHDVYADVLGHEAFSAMSDRARKIWRATFGPWIGSDWKNVSLHHVGHFFKQNFFPGPKHHHPADEHGPAWTHGGKEGWLLLRGPSSEVWFDPWVRYLESKGVQFVYRSTLDKLDVYDNKIVRAHLTDGTIVEADMFVLAVHPFAARDIVARTHALAGDTELSRFKPLTAEGPHTQVSFRIGFRDKIRFPKPTPGTLRGGIILADSEYNLTLFPQEIAWLPGTHLGDDVRSLWTVTACVSEERGSSGLSLRRCEKDEFLEECMLQMHRCKALQAMLRSANDGHDMKDFVVMRTEVWHEWEFSRLGIKAKQPKWVNAVQTQKYRPGQATSFVNLVLAGAHTQTTADIWSIEGAVESGRLAAKIVDPRVAVLRQYKHPVIHSLATFDDVLYFLKLPHLFELLIRCAFVGMIVLLLWVTR